MYQDPEISAMNQVYETFKNLDNNQRSRIIKWITQRFGLYENIIDTIQQPVTVEILKSAVESDSFKPSPVLPKGKPGRKKAEKKVEIESEETEKISTEKIPGKRGRKKVEKIPEQPQKRKRRTKAEVEADRARQKEEKLKQKELKKAKKMQPPAETTITLPADQLKPQAIITPVYPSIISEYNSIETLFLSSTVSSVPSRIILAAAYLQEAKGMKSFSSYELNSLLKTLGYGVGNISSYVRQLLSKKIPLLVQVRKEGKSSAGHGVFRVTEEGIRVAVSYLNTKQS